MPTYEYRCPNGHAFEKFSPRITARRRMRCPTCGKMAERVISGGAALVFKGSGFYATDYKRAGEKRSEGESKSAESKASEKGEKRTEGEAKPAESKAPEKKSGSTDQ